MSPFQCLSPIESHEKQLLEMGRINFDDYDIYNGDYNYGSAYESSPEESFYFPRGQTFDFSRNDLAVVSLYAWNLGTHLIDFHTAVSSSLIARNKS